MSGHPCGWCLRWPECDGTAWGTPDCPHGREIHLTTSGPVREDLEAQARNPAPDPALLWPKHNLYIDDKTESGLLEDDNGF